MSFSAASRAIASVGPRPMVIRLLARDSGRQRRAPIERACGGETVGQALDCGPERVVIRPGRGQAQQNRKGGDEGFGGGDTQLRSRGHRQRHVADRGQRTVGVIHDRGRQRAGCFRHLRELGEILAAAGLRDRQKQLPLELHAPAIERLDIRRRGGDRNAEMTLDQMFAEGRGMRRAAARAGQDNAG